MVTNNLALLILVNYKTGLKLHNFYEVDYSIAVSQVEKKLVQDAFS
jgi:hypothetical protein